MGNTKRALVTGGTRGIGSAIAEKLLGLGYEVWITSATQATDRAKRRLQIDFSDRAASEKFANEISGMGFDVLVNNAGINKVSEFEKIEMSDFDRILEVNLRSAMLLCRAVVPSMRQKKWGRIINVTSIFGVVSREFRGSYSSSKFGMDGMIAALAAEVAKYGILANSVAPGFVDTDMTRTVLGEKGMAEIQSKIPAGRLAQPAEIAELVSWLSSEKNSYVSGQSIAIDGGYTRV